MKTIRRTLFLLSWILNFYLVFFSSYSTASSNRQLQGGDFVELNNLIRDAVVRLPEAALWDGFGTLNIENLQCSNLHIDDILIDTTKQRRQFVVGVEIKGLDMICRADYWYDGFLFFDADGSIYVESFNNEATTSTVFTSRTFDQFPPRDSFINQCNPVVNINKLDFNGSFLSFVLDALEGLVRDHLENAAEKRLCDELGERSSTNMDEMLQRARQKLASYDPTKNENDPLLLEKNLLVRDESIRLLNLEEKETAFGFWMDQALQNSVSYLNSKAPTSAGGSDMNMNIMLRENLLDNGAHVFDIADFPLDGVIYDEHNRLMRTTIKVTSVKLLGLDSLTKFEPLSNIGQYTLQSELSWDNLSFELDLTVEIQPSTLANSYIVNPGSASGVTERVRVSFGIDSLEAAISILLAIDQDELEALQLGSFLDKENILPCIASSIFTAEVSDLSVAAINIRPPTLSGFISPGIDRVVSAMVDTAFAMYESSLLQAAPAYFQTVVRKILNENITEKYEDYSRAGCTMLDIPGPLGSMDFRDLILLPMQALLDGGYGTGRYGDLFSSFVIPNTREQMFTDNKVNSRLIQPLTKNQSGVEGMLSFPSEIFTFAKGTKGSNESPWTMSLWDRFEVTAFNATVRNLDTVTQPLSLFDPVASNELSNRVSFGGEIPSLRPLIFTVRALSFVQGEKHPLGMKNEVEIQVRVPSSVLAVNVLATMDEDKVLNFPLKDVTNFYCWLATIQHPPETDLESLSLKGFRTDLISSSLDVSCVSCTNPGSEALPAIFHALEQSGFSPLLLPRAERLLEELLNGLWNNLNTDRLLEDSGKFCPHSPNYSEEALPADYGWPGSLSLSREAVETVLIASVLTLQAALVAIAKNNLSPSQQQTSILVSNSWPSSFPDNSSDVRTLDWENLSLGVGSWADMALKRARLYVEEVIVDESKTLKRSQDLSEIYDSTIWDIRANILVRNLFLDEDGMYMINFDDFSFKTAGVKVSLAGMRISGLDSIAQLETLIVTGPQNLQNNFLLNRIHMEIDFDVEHAPNITETMTLSFHAEDIDIKTNMLVVMDLDKLGGIELGGILHINQIFPCIMTGLHKLHISQLLVNVGSIDHPDIEGFISSDFRADSNYVMRTFFERFRTDFIDSIPNIFDNLVRDILNNILGNSENMEKFSCSVPPDTPNKGLVDFRDLLLTETTSRKFGGQGNSPYGNLFPTLYNELSQNYLDLNTTAINALVSSLTKKQSDVSGTMNFLGTVLESNGSLTLAGLDADAAFKISDVYFQNLDSLVGPLELFQPVMSLPNVLNNNVSFGVGGKSVRLGGRIMVSLSDGVEMQIRNEVDVSVDLDTVRIFVTFILNLANSAFLSFPMRDIPNVNCWLAAIDSPSGDLNERGIGLINDVVTIDNIDLNITCVSCTSPQFDSLISQLYNFTAADIENTIYKVLDGNAFNEFLDDAPMKCPQYVGGAKEAQQYLRDPSSSSFALGESFRRDNRSIAYIIAVNGAVAACLLLLLVLVKWIVHKRNSAWIDSLSNEGLSLFRKQEEREREEETMLNSTTTSMFRSPCIPRRIQILFPVTILTNILLYIGAHVFVLSSLDIDVQIAGETFTIYRFLEFKFFDAVMNTYKNGGIEMSIMLWIFTGIWPYIKLLSSFFLWFIRPAILSVSNRERTLLWLEALTKLSPVDIFTTLIAFAIILVYIGGPDEALSVDGGVFYSMKIIVVPSVGCYCIVIAQRMSRVSSRLFLDYHYQVVDAARKAEERRSIIEEQRKNGDFEQPTEPGSCIRGCDDGIRVFDGANEGTCQGRSYNDGIRVHGNECIQDGADRSTRDKKIVSSDNSERRHLGRVFTLPHKLFRKLCFEKPQNGVEAVSDVEYNPFSDGDSTDSFFEGVSNGDEVNEVPIYRRVTNFLLKNIGVSFVGLTVVALVIIGCIYAPSIALDTTDVWHLALESGTTFEQAVTEYGVFSVVSTVLLKARFVLDTAWDYVGLGFLLAVVVLSIGITFLVGCYHFCRRLRDRWVQGLREQQPVYDLTPYCRLHAYKHMEIYFVSVVIGCWQLGSVASYGIHLYCSIIYSAYQFLVNVGLAEDSTAQCFREQISLPDNLLILFGSFGILTVKFFLQAIQQYRTNVNHAYSLIHKNDVEILAGVWDTKKLSKTSLQLNDTASLSNSLDEDVMDTKR